MSGFFDNFRRLLGWWNSVQPLAVLYLIDQSQEHTSQRRRTAGIACDRHTSHDNKVRRTSFTPPKARQ